MIYRSMQDMDKVLQLLSLVFTGDLSKNTNASTNTRESKQNKTNEFGGNEMISDDVTI